MSKIRSMNFLFLALLIAALSVVSPSAQAQHTDSVYNGWISAYQVTDGSNFYLAKSFTDRSAGFWSQGYLIFEAQDAYFQSHKASRYAQVVQLLDDFLAKNPVSGWTNDTWDDDLEWIVYAYIRGYEITGNTTYLNAATSTWNAVYSRGRDNTFGGGIWEENGGRDSKCVLSNAPFVIEGMELYRATGTSTYLTESEEIYAWTRANLFNSTNSTNSLGAPGQANECIHSYGLSASDTVYNTSLMVNAATALYRDTQTASYLSDAQLAASHIMSNWPIMNKDYPQNGYFSGDQFYRGISALATQNNLWGTYQTYVQNNANAAWNTRRTDYNISHNDWTTTTPGGTSPDLYAMEAAASVDVQAALPLTSSFSGNYEIQNVNSGLALDIAGGSTSGGAAVVQNTYTGTSSQLWTLVATAGGYYQIKNVKSGLVLNVKGHSTTSQALIQQYAAQGPTPGNDRWFPAWNVADSTYSFYNLNSQMALDVPGASKSTGVQLEQYFTNNNTNQKFNLISR
ncbi:MAG TPA: RICIN domain-containing protein [Acidobacteriaceae bacterium]|nr:RICIN domain-containing protein [Acidobacteriaceae bacterium]